MWGWALSAANECHIFFIMSLETLDYKIKDRPNQYFLSKILTIPSPPFVWFWIFQRYDFGRVILSFIQSLSDQHFASSLYKSVVAVKRSCNAIAVASEVMELALCATCWAHFSRMRHSSLSDGNVTLAHWTNTFLEGDSGFVQFSLDQSD